MGMFSFKLPDLGEGIVESEVAEWHVRVGDAVEEDQHIADVMTDKAMVEVTAPVSGTVVALACEAGDILAVGKELIRFEIDGEGNAAGSVNTEPTPQDTASAKEEPVAKQQASKELFEPVAPVAKPAVKGDAPAAAPVFPSATILASPSLRRRAMQEKIDLALVPGSGPAGRISHEDFDNFIAAGGELAFRGPLQGKMARTGSTEVKIKGLRRVIAQKMQQSKRNIPHYSYIEEVDVTNLEELRQHLNAHRSEGQAKLTLLPFLVQALVKILPQFPHCNARFDDEAGVLTQVDAVHMGIATMTDAGLMVPVIKHCEALSVWQVASNITQLSQAVRDNTAKQDALSGSTITITSLGAIGGIATTPVINAPETSIIGVNKMQERPVIRNGAIVARKMMNISASFDHRIVDGFDGAQLVQALKGLLENPGAIFVEAA